jgi:EAL domain-containing protein (putative c-di-GMP-specific phosphodiesterase class I)/DNA-binding response OmpR family regulator
MNPISTPIPKLALIVDDNADNLRLLHYSLQGLGLRVIEAANGQEALRVFKQAQPDIILLDAMMPVMDGFETCRRLRNTPEGQTIPILMITSLTDNNSVEKAYAYGVTEFISKPIQWAVLKHRIIHLLNDKGLETNKPNLAAEKSVIGPRELAGMTAKLDDNFYKFSIPNQTLIEQLRIKRDLPWALQKKELHLNYQPQIDFITGKMVGVEALVRWHHPDLGLIGPDRFIGLAEETGLIIKIGYWVLEQACNDCKNWQEKKYPTIKVAVNVSPKQLNEPDFVDKVEQILDKSGLEARYLELEITESIHLKNLGDTYNTLNRLRKIGIEIAVDDFGTGYSSLSYLQHLPIDVLKIDASFIRSLGRDQIKDLNSEAILKAIVTLAQALELVVIAEGVESNYQLDALRKIGCQRVQGFLFSKPLPQENLEDFFLERFVTARL